MRRVCTILARAGSVGVPGKNVRDLAGIPLVAHSIRHARSSGLFSAVVVSTDDPKVIEIAQDERVDHVVHRPKELASDTSPKLPALQHAVENAESTLGERFAVVVDLQPTSPLRVPEDIHRVVEMLESGPRSHNVVTGCRSHKSPYFDVVQSDGDEFVRLVAPPGPDGPVVRRQDAPITYDLNGSIYGWWRDALMSAREVIGPRTRLCEMPAERSVDIDSKLDFRVAEFLHEFLHSSGPEDAVRTGSEVR